MSSELIRKVDSVLEKANMPDSFHKSFPPLVQCHRRMVPWQSKLRGGPAHISVGGCSAAWGLHSSPRCRGAPETKLSRASNYGLSKKRAGNKRESRAQLARRVQYNREPGFSDTVSGILSRVHGLTR